MFATRILWSAVEERLLPLLTLQHLSNLLLYMKVTLTLYTHTPYKKEKSLQTLSQSIIFNFSALVGLRFISFLFAVMRFLRCFWYKGY